MSDRPWGESAARILHLIRRATRSGYLLTRDSPTPYLWQLRDADDHTPIHSAETLDEIERWLDE
ncbi:hypothetical protein [Nocardia vaccinii]|uniref:hypothetical protein n=1 Tax=Nocardia vaccinii TaxID=1822 RepID=UPI00082AA979|nr:hypothetical protein [Nocardia vaccinii]